MKVTYKGDYALKAVLDLALHYGSEAVTINDIARRIDAPVKFLEQILLDLKKGGFVESRRGKIGGYLLSKAPGKIRVGEVIRFMDGPIEPISCVRHEYSGCKDLHKCVFRDMWQQVFEATSKIVDNVTLEDLAVKASPAQHFDTYSI
jgi:Rrf2 family cysteine metabolism transcriptional repressor